MGNFSDRVKNNLFPLCIQRVGASCIFLACVSLNNMKELKKDHFLFQNPFVDFFIFFSYLFVCLFNCTGSAIRTSRLLNVKPCLQAL